MSQAQQGLGNEEERRRRKRGGEGDREEGGEEIRRRGGKKGEEEKEGEERRRRRGGEGNRRRRGGEGEKWTGGEGGGEVQVNGFDCQGLHEKSYCSEAWVILCMCSGGGVVPRTHSKLCKCLERVAAERFDRCGACGAQLGWRRGDWGKSKALNFKMRRG